MERVLADEDDDLPLDPPEDEASEETEVESDEQEQEGEQEDQPQDEQPVEAGDQQRDQQERQPTGRADRRIQSLRDEIRQRDTRMADLERRLNESLARQTPVQQTGETPDQRAQRMALLTPEERMHETLREAEIRHTQQLNQVSFQLQDGQDKTAFQAKSLVDPLYQKWESKVEAELAVLRTKNQNVPREALMFYLIGQNAVTNRKEAGKQQRAQAERRVNAQRTRPNNARSDTASERRSQGNTLERRLENVQL